MISNETLTPTIEKKAREDRFQFHDHYLVEDLLEDDHRMARAAVRDWVKQEVSPIIEEYSEQAKCPTHLYKGLADIGAFGPSIPVEYGGGGMDEIAYGVIMQELERGDSGIRSMASVQGSLVMYPIYRYGSEEQKRKYLPKLGSGEFIGCFGLTEPDHGSNPSGMVTNIKDDGDCYILNGAKMWITNSPLADVAVVWAKDEEGVIRGVIVE
ncbi:MAG: acyl-CoA dehydrogenase family protein, partial [Bacteroidota bacterium]